MATTQIPKGKAEVDALIAAQKLQATQGAAPTTSIPVGKAQVDALLASQKQTQPGAVQEPTAPKQNLLTSLAKPFLKGATNVLNVAEGVGKMLGGKPIGDAATRSRDFGIFGQDIRPVGVNDEGNLKNVGGFAKDVVGTGLEIGSYAAPGAVGVGSKVIKGGTVGANLTRNVAAPTIKSFVKGGALAGGSGALGSGLQEDQSFGKTVAQTVGGTLLGGALGGAIPGLGAGVKKVGNAAGRLGSEILGRTTGSGEAAIREAFNNPNVVKFARQAGKEGPEGLMKEALEEAGSGLDRITSGNNKSYREAMKRIKASPQDLSNAVSDIRADIVREASENFGIRFADGKKLNNLDFNASDVVEGSNSVQRAFDRFFAEPISTIEDLDRVKKSLGRLAQGAPARSPAQALIYKMKDAVSGSLKTKVPGYAEEMGRYSDAAELADEIRRVLSLGDKASTDTTIRKLMSTMRQNNELRNEMLSELGKTGGTDIVGKIAGITLSTKMPRGLTGALAPTLTGLPSIALAAFSLKTIPFVLMYLASTSPRAMAEAVALLAKVKGKTLPLVVKTQLRNLMIQAEREAATSEDPAR